MPDAAPFLAAIRAAPDDDAPRLVYADWLDEHDQPERAEFIRVQCELARNDSPTLRQREAELLAEHHLTFAGPLAAQHIHSNFHRGFIVHFGHIGVFEGHHGVLSILFRFFSDGLVIAMTGRHSEQIAESFRRTNMYLLRGSYQLETSESPATIRFFCNSATNHEEIRFSGEFGPYQLNPDGHCRYCGYAMLRPFIHSYVIGLDSWSESPQDAV